MGLVEKSFRRLRLSLLGPVEQCPVAEEDDDKARSAVEAAENAEVVAPLKLLIEQPGEEGPEKGSTSETEGPDVDFACPLVEEEHIWECQQLLNREVLQIFIVDNGKADDLGRRAKKAFKGTAGCE